MGVWAPVQYGWGVVYWLTIEGIPVVWIERETALTLPATFPAQDASLVIDRSSEVGQLVDRETGLGAGFPLTLQLLDTVTVRTWLRRWGLQASLSQSVAWNDAAIHVDDVTGWPAAGTFWLGLERVTYTGTAGGADPRFTGCTRGTGGSLASKHFAGTVGSLATDLPRWWRGRQVRLYASPVAPSGTMTGAALLDEAEEIWRGTLDQGPDRVAGQWELQAQALDRRLDQQLAAEVTGKVVDQQPRFRVEPGYNFAVRIAGWNAASPPVKLWDFEVLCEPFTSHASGDLLTAAQQADEIKAAWAAALPLTANLVTGIFDAATYLGELILTGFANSVWIIEVAMQAAAVPVNGTLGNRCAFNYGESNAIVVQSFPWGITAGQKYQLNWQSNGDLVAGAYAAGGLSTIVPSGVAVELDAPLAALPTWGTLRVDGDEFVYTKAEQAGMLVFFSGFYDAKQKPIDKSKFKPGANVELVAGNGGDAKDVMRELLSSSGTGQRGTYDTLSYGQGYGLDGSTAATSAVNNASFDAMAAGPLVALPVDVQLAGKTFAECLGGLLALSQRGVVVRGDDLLGYRRQRLALVSTEPGGGNWGTLITDAHLLTTQGEPVVAVRKRDVPNPVRVTVPQGAESPDMFSVQDAPAAAQQGVVAADYELPLHGKVTGEQVTQWALARFVPAQTEQAIELQLVPWLDIDVGDLVRLQITHHAVWQWSTGTPGYTGNGRVLGIKRDLKVGAVTATVLIDGTTQKLALCPAMQVTSWAGPAAAPTKIVVQQRFYIHCAKTLSQGGGVMWLIHFEAGLGGEASGGKFRISAATDTGAACELTVSGSSGAPVLSAYSWLTLPETAGASDYQKGFAHVGDSSSWG